MKKMIVVLIVLMLTGMVFATNYTYVPAAAEIDKINVYTQYGDGDVAFTIKTSIEGIDGFWLSPADPGFQQNLSLLYLAKATNMAVQVVYLPDEWSGSSVSYRKVYCLILQ